VKAYPSDSSKIEHAPSWDLSSSSFSWTTSFFFEDPVTACFLDVWPAVRVALPFVGSLFYSLFCA